MAGSFSLIFIYIWVDVTCRGGTDIVDSDDDGEAPSKSRRKPKKKPVKESAEGLSAKQRRKVVSKATISDTDSSESGGEKGTGPNTANSSRWVMTYFMQEQRVVTCRFLYILSSLHS